MNICSSSVHPGSNRTHLQARRPLRSDHARSSPPPVVLVTGFTLPAARSSRHCVHALHFFIFLNRSSIAGISSILIVAGFGPASGHSGSPSKSAGPAFLIPVTASVRGPCCRNSTATIKANSRMLAFPPPQPAADERQQSGQASADDGTGGMYRRRVCERRDDIRAKVTVGIRAVTHELELEL